MSDTLFLAEGIEAAITSTYGIDASSEATGFAAENLLDRNQNTLWKSGVTASPTIKIDLGTARAVTAIALINANPLTGGGYDGTKWTLRLESDDNWSFSTPTVHLNSIAPVTGDEPIWFETFTGATERYWKITTYSAIADTTQIGTVLLGTHFEPPFPYSRPRRYRSQYGIEMIETKGGIRYSNLLHDERLIWNSINYDAMPTADMDNFLDQLWRQSKGCHYPFLFKDVNDSLWWVRANIGGALDYEEAKNQLWSTGVTLEQEF